MNGIITKGSLFQIRMQPGVVAIGLIAAVAVVLQYALHKAPCHSSMVVDFKLKD